MTDDNEPHRTFLTFYLGVLKATGDKLVDTDGDAEAAGKVIAEHVDAIDDRAAKHVLKTKLAYDALHAYDLGRRMAADALEEIDSEAFDRTLGDDPTLN